MAREKKPVHRVQMTEGKHNIIHRLLEEYDIQSAEDIQDALKDLLGGTIKEMMEAEMDEHLGYEKSEHYNSDDYRNGAKAEFQEQLKRNKLVNETTSQRMCKYMDAAHWNTSIFQNRTLLAPMDYTRVYQNHKFKVPSYTAMAVGLELTLHETEEALRLSGLGYDNSDDTDYAYMYILSAFHGCPIDECNTVLEKLNVKPLGTKSKK